MIRKDLKGITGMLVATLLWGMTFAFIKEAVAEISPANFVFARFALSTLAFLPLVFFRKEVFETQNIKVGALLGCLLFGTVFFQTWGLETTNASTASFITGLSVVFVGIFHYLTLQKRPTRGYLASLGISLTGLGLISLNQPSSALLGNLLVLICAICFALFIFFSKRFSGETDTLSVTFYNLSTITILSFVLAHMQTGGIELGYSEKVWYALIFCSLFATCLAFFLQLAAQRHIPATQSAVIFTLEPVFATLTAVLLIDESLSYRFVFGAALILIAMFIRHEPQVKVAT